MAVQELQGLSRSDAVPPSPAARDQGRQQWWLELVVCTASAAGACVVAGAGGQTHTCSGGGQSRQKRLEPATGVLAAAGALAIMMQALTAASHHCCGAVVASYGGPGQGSAGARQEGLAVQAVTEAKAFCRPTSAPVFPEASGSRCALLRLDNVPLDTCTAVEASDECEASTQQKGALPECTHGRGVQLQESRLKS